MLDGKKDIFPEDSLITVLHYSLIIDENGYTENEKVRLASETTSYS
jgi:hypothetical protein